MKALNTKLGSHMIETHFIKIRRRNSRRGTILVFVAISIVVLIGLIGLVTDAGIVASTRHQMNSAAQVAALGAMSRYLNALQHPELAGGQEIHKYAALEAKDRAKEILSENQPLGQLFLKNPSDKIIDITLAVDSMTSSTANNGTLTIGDYYAIKPATETSATTACNLKYPCYVDAPAGRLYQGNAMKLSLHLENNNLLQTQFMRVLGIPSVKLQTTVYASLIPRNDVFLLDLSGSTAGDSYSVKGIPGASGIKTGSVSVMTYPVPIYEPGVMSDFFTCTDTSCAIPSIPPWIFDKYLGLWDFGPYYQKLCNSSDALPNATCLDPSLNDSNPLVHFKDRYRGRVINFGKDLTKPLTGNADYVPTLLVDYDNPISSGNDNYLATPQPLISMLQSLGTAMDTIADRSVSADRMSFTGFDTDIYEKRTTCAAGSADCSDRFVAPSDTKFTDLQAVLNKLQTGVTANSGTGDFISKNALVPLPTWTDIILILLDALQQITIRENVSTAKNSIFLFTDGVATCGAGPDGISKILGVFLGNWGNLEKQIDEWVTFRICDTSYSNFLSAYDFFSWIKLNPIGFLVDNFKARRISVSVILFGNGIKPHYLLRKTYNEDGQGCLKMEEAVTDVINNPKFVDASMDNPSAEFSKLIAGTDANFFAPNKLYDLLVKPTKGAWIPIMPPLNPDPITGYGVDFSEDLEDACSSNALQPGQLVVIGGDSNGDGFADGLMKYGTAVTDYKGRVLYDPKGRPVKQQIEDAMQKVLTDPYVLVVPAAGDI